MPDRFNELLSNLEQQISKALAEARATQTEPLERSREVESRFDMISPGHKQPEPLSFASPKPEGGGTGGGLNDIGYDAGDSLDADGAWRGTTSEHTGLASPPAPSYAGRVTSEEQSAMEEGRPPQTASSQPEVIVNGDGGTQRAFAHASEVNVQSGGPDGAEEICPPEPVSWQPPKDLEAPDLSTSDIVSDEDARIDFSRLLQAGTGGQAGTLTVTVAGVPEGASFSAGTQIAPGVWSFTEAQLKGLAFNPPANSDADFSLKVVATLTDAAGRVAVNTGQIDVQIDAVADKPIVNHESGALSEIVLRVSADYYQGSPNLKIDIDGQVLGTFRLTADHRTGEWQEIRIVGDFGPNGPQNIGVSYINDHYHGTSATDRNIYVDWIEVNGKTYQSEGSGVAYNRGGDTISGQEGMYWNGRMSFDTSGNGGPQANVAVGQEDSAVTLNLKAMLADTDGSETLSIRISGLPDGVQLSAGTHNADGSWTLTPAQLSGLTVIPPANFNGQFTLRVEATATEGANGDKATTHFDLPVHIAPVNDAPYALTLSGTSVTENAAGAIIGNLGVSDIDAGDSVLYSVSDSRFEVVDGVLKLKAGVSLNYEAAPTINLKITATDTAGATTTLNTVIQVNNVNEAPSTPSLSSTSVNENAVGATIGKLTVTDPDAGDSLNYSLSDNRFEIVDGYLKLKPGVSFDHETQPTVSLRITATDSGGLTSAKDFTITVKNVNEAPSTPNVSIVPVAENAAGAIVGQVTTTDPDAGDSIRYTVSDGRFEVVGGAIKLKDGVSLNYETTPSVTFKVTATDNGGLKSEKTVTVNVTNVNEAPTTPTLAASTVAENAAGATIGKVTATDPDAGDTITYGVSDARFEIVGGYLKLKPGVSLDHESEPVVNLKIIATDSGGLVSEKAVAITVTNVNEAPYGLGLSNSSVAENAAGAVVGQLSASDPDGNALTYTVSDNRFEVVDGQLKLKADVSFDHETTPPISLKVTATDPGGLKVEKTFTINVTNVNEAPSQPTLSANTVAENAAGAVIGKVAAADPDTGDTLQYSVSDNRFEIVNGDLKLKTGVSLNYEAEPTVNVKVTATDAGGLSSEKTFTVNVTNVNEAPDAPTLSNNTVAENAAGAVVGKVSALDSDAGDSLQYSVSDSRFEIVNGDLKLKAGVLLNYEAEPSVSVKVTATDTGGLASEKTFAITVTDVNEAPQAVAVQDQFALRGDGFSLNGGQYFSDVDTGDHLTYSISGPSWMTIDPATGAITGTPPSVASDLSMTGGVYNLGGASSIVLDTTTFAGSAGHDNSIGFYVADANGNPIGGQVLYISAKDYAARHVELDLSAYSGAKSIGFFIVENGNNLSHTATNGSPVTFTQVSGGWAVVWGANGSTASTYFSNSALNADGISHLTDNAAQGSLNWEDLWGGGDKDYDDVNMSAAVRAYSEPASVAQQVTVTATDAGGLATSVTFQVTVADERADNLQGTSYGDIIHAGAGDDVLRGNGGADQLYGGAGNDLIYIDAQDTIVQGGDGYDKVIVTGQAGVTLNLAASSIEYVEGGAGNDIFNASAASFATTQYGGIGNDMLIGGTGNDIFYGGAGDDNISAGAGSDKAYLGDGNDIFDTVNGDRDETDGPDTVYGEGGHDSIWGGGDTDLLYGGDGNDYVNGESGNDTIYGDAGNDSLYGDNGQDTIYGGTGDDVLYGGSENDTLFGGSGADKLYGGTGADTLKGDAGLDILYGGSSNDTLYGGDDADQLYGEDGDDALYGGNGDDTLFGGLGNDTLDGGTGNDVLNGGDGGDMFMYAKGTGWDTIYGGEGNGWLDTIHVSGVASGLDANGLGTDWTLQIDNGGIVSADDHGLTLSQDTDGSIVFNDGTTVAFHNIERIEWS